MADVTWTQEQLAAITARNPGILVSAGAGSGKTAVLTERVVQRIFDPVDPVDADRMLIVTFTRAAAEEMRERIAVKLRAVQREHPEDSSVARQLILLEKADISTVHAFCQRIVKENFQLLDIQSGFRIADEKELEVWRTEAAGEILEEEYAAGEGSFLSLVELLSEERSDRRVTDTLLRLYDFVRAHPFYEAWLEQALERYRSEAPIGETDWGKLLIADALSGARQALEAMEEARDLLDGDEKIQKAYGSYVATLYAAAKGILDCLTAGDWDGAYQAAQHIDGRFSALRGYEDEWKKARVTALRDQAKELLEDLRDEVFLCTEEQFQSDRRALLPMVEKLFAMTAELDRRYAERKRAQNALDFSDLEHLAIRLLIERSPEGEEHPTRLAEELSRQFRQVFVDEYQDTNAVQDRIFRAVSDNGRNLFMVGDVKQSIYRFRQADPAIFLEKKEQFAPWPAQADQPAAISLNRNFRSRQEVTEGINFLFEQTMSRTVGEMDYRDGEQLQAGAVYPPAEGCGCEVHLVQKQKGEDSAREQEAEYIAGLIEEMIHSGYQVSDHGVMRPVRPADICILLRSVKDKAGVYLQALEKRGISGIGENGGGYLYSREISAVLSLLRAVDNPLLDIDLAAAMLSPLAAFTPDELAEIRLKGRDRSLYACLVLHAQENAKSADFLRLVQHLRARSAGIPVSRLITELYDLTGFEAVARSMENGRQRLQNLRLLPEYAAGYEERGYSGLSAFLRLIDRLVESGADLDKGTVVSAGENTVTVMSIHKSKGLEFPVVILADCGKTFNRQDLSAPALLHGKLGFACRLRDQQRRLEYDTLPLAALRRKLGAELCSEELRMLYVALTRARERLILVGTVSTTQDKFCAKEVTDLEDGRLPAAAVRGGSTYLDWIVMALLHHPDGTALRELADCEEEFPASCPGHFRIFTGLEAESRTAEAAPEEELPPPDPALTEELRQEMDWQYPWQDATELSSKFAISHLAEEVGEVEKPRFAARPAYLYKQGLTPAEKGSAMHTYMQFCSYPAAARDADAELERLMADRFLTEEQGAAIETDRIRTFFESPLYRRISAARQVWREYRFLAVIGEEELAGLADAGLGENRTTVQGVADCIFEEEDGIVIVDYKTDRVFSEDALRERYRVQLGLYGRLIGRTLGRPVKECLLYSFALGRTIEVPF